MYWSPPKEIHKLPISDDQPRHLPVWDETANIYVEVYVYANINVVILYSDQLVQCVSSNGWFMVFLTAGLNGLTVISNLNDAMIVWTEFWWKIKPSLRV